MKLQNAFKERTYAAKAGPSSGPSSTTTQKVTLTMDEKKAILLNEARYAERLTQRTARLYRRVAWACSFAGVIGGSSVLTALSSSFPSWVAVAGGALSAVVAGVALTVRPLEKAVLNESDAKKYAALRTAGVTMTETEFAVALNKARETDAAEVETLRDVAWNDVMTEVGRDDLRVALRPHQQVLGALA